MPVPNQNLTPQQMQSLMMMRALQGRGRGQVRTGYPQFIPLGMPAMIPHPQAFQNNQGYAGQNQAAGQGNPAAGGGDQNGPPADAQAADAPKSSKEKRIEARKAAEERKQAAREAREAKIKERAEKAKQAKAAREAKAG
jgi:hypothetical protein